MSAPSPSVPVVKPSTNQKVPGALRTDPKTFLVRGVGMLSQLAIPLAIASFTMLDDGDLSTLLAFALPAVILIVGLNFLFAYLHWSRLTYVVGEQDIRVESGILSRAARSVPFERIQDVSLEQKFVPRLFGLVEVKFETGSGGGEDLSLTYLSAEEGERLRRVVRQRREGLKSAEGEAQSVGTVPEEADDEAAETLFTMGPRRLFVFGAFEFSLAVFAVLGGLLQYVETFSDIEIWDPDLWQRWIESQSGWVSGLGYAAQAVGAVAGLIAVFVIGSATGLVRTFLREWEFLLEKTSRGFRRRRGLLTKTDVVMPVHRVQALTIGTRAIRYRFGWHSLKFVSLAQDAGSSSHVVAPFAQLDEIEPIVEAAGFRPVDEKVDWHLASKAHRNANMLIAGGTMILLAIAAYVLAAFGELSRLENGVLLPLVPLSFGMFLLARRYYLWRFARNAIDDTQIYRRGGWLSPATMIATRLKIHSVEITRSPLARWRGYATLHLGLAGGNFSIPGVPIERAIEVRDAVLETIADTDFSQIDKS